jgi:hypothetical protein
MEFPAPIPPPILFPNNFTLPEPVVLETPGPEFQWEPVPIFVEDVPNPIPSPEPRPDVAEDTVEEQEAEEQKERREQEEKTEGPNKGENKEPTEAGKPPPVDMPPIDLVPEIAEIQTVELPIIGVEIPLPRTEILVTATTTAGVSSVVAVGGTLFATTMFRQLQPILKPIFKILLKKLAALRKKPPPMSFGREKLLARRQRKVDKKDLKGG